MVWVVAPGCEGLIYNVKMAQNFKKTLTVKTKNKDDPLLLKPKTT